MTKLPIRIHLLAVTKITAGAGGARTEPCEVICFGHPELPHASYTVSIRRLPLSTLPET